MEKMTDEEITALMIGAGLTEKQVEELRHVGLLRSPASMRHHLAEPGGLITHSINVGTALYKISMALDVKWTRPTGPMIVGLLHDLCKTLSYIEGYDAVNKRTFYKWNKAWPYGDGHGAVSIKLIEELGIKLEEDERYAITFHMGRFGIGREYLESDYNEALKRFGPQVLTTHFADWYSSQCLEEQAK